jgi:quercetin dioxygenase-like cupin family protein
MSASPTPTPSRLPGDLAQRLVGAQLVLPCTDFTATVAFFTDTLGFRLETIFPADAPSTAVVTGAGLSLRLEASAAPLPTGRAAPSLRLTCRPGTHGGLVAGEALRFTGPGGLQVELVGTETQVEVPEGHQAFVLSRMPADRAAWGVGRAGMQYRDLIPDRLGGRYIASHIMIPDGGPVPDYVHYHHVRFQLIFCKAGWVRVVYEDQGPSFVLEAGDCVLQPPGIRHRVLEASPGLEVVEIGCPAVHETCVEHGFDLPTPRLDPARRFGGQRFVRHIAAAAAWRPAGLPGAEVADTDIATATDGLASVRVLRSATGGAPGTASQHDGDFLFLFVLGGRLSLASAELGHHDLATGDSVVIPAGVPYALQAGPGLDLLEVALPPARG